MITFSYTKYFVHSYTIDVVFTLSYQCSYPCGVAMDAFSLQNKIWNLPDQSTILPTFIYDKERKLGRPTLVLPVRVRGPARVLKTAFGSPLLNFLDLHIFELMQYMQM